MVNNIKNWNKSQNSIKYNVFSKVDSPLFSKEILAIEILTTVSDQLTMYILSGQILEFGSLECLLISVCVCCSSLSTNYTLRYVK